MVPFRLTVLGPPTLQAPNGDPIRFRTRKHFALLIYLAIEPSVAHRRDKLANMLWAHAAVDEGRHSLATGLSLLRGRVGSAAFETTRDTIRLSPGAVVSDLSLLERDDPVDSHGVLLGAFLEDFDIDDANDFQQWKDAQRARLLPLIHSALTRRIDYYRKRGDWREMEQLAQQLLRLDDLSEHASRAQVEARAMAGDRIGALRCFDAWRNRLANELGALPSLALARMVDRLRRNSWEGPPPVTRGPALSSQSHEATFIGRGPEFAALYDVWEQVRAGRPTHVLLRGDTGVGKTTLVERFATSVALEGASVARMKGFELERELPFGMIGGLVGQLLDLPGASAASPDSLAELGRLVTKVRQRYPSLPTPPLSLGETARMLFTESVISLVRAIADESPVVLIVDDIHLADATSLAVLHLMLRRVVDLPLMCVLTSSSAQGVETPEVRRFGDCTDAIAVSQVHLGPLSEHEAKELLDALLRHEPSHGPTLRRAILTGAHGNPMALELLVSDWRRRGSHCLALSLGAMTTVTHSPPEEAFRRVVNHTLVDLDDESRSVAELGAILGRRLNDLSMYALIDLPVARTMRAMTSLTAQCILRDAGNLLEFTNEFVRGQCYVAMAAPLRRMLHGSVANRLLLQDVADEPIPRLEIAWHLVRADRLSEAVPYLLAGGREAIRRAAPHEADLALSTGLAALSGSARRTGVLLLAEAQQELGRWEESLQLLDLADEPFDEAEICCREVYRTIARRWLGCMTPRDMKDATDRLLHYAASDIDIDTRVKALTASIRLLGLTRDTNQLATLRDIVLRVRRLGMDTYQQLHVILSHAWILAVGHDSDGALVEVMRGVHLAETASITSSIAVRLMIGEGNLLCMKGRYAEAVTPLTRAESTAARLDNRTLRAECAAQLAMVNGRLGRSSAAITWARQALTDFAPTECSAASIAAVYELGLGLLADGRPAEAQSVVRILSRLNERDAPNWAVQAGLLYEADVLALSGNTRRAFMLAKKGTTGGLSTLQHVAYAGQFARWIALLGVRDSNENEARDRLRRTFESTAHLDSKDQAEVIASIALLDSRLGSDSTVEDRDVEQRLTQLPESVRNVMRRLGVFPEQSARIHRNRAYSH